MVEPYRRRSSKAYEFNDKSTYANNIIILTRVIFKGWFGEAMAP
jgi:hypothetical protein